MVYYDDEWRHAPEPPPAPVRLKRRTRAEMQEHFDNAYGQGRITRDQWSRHFDLLSLVTADGQILHCHPELSAP